jgi:hypothetical protein
LYRIGKANNRLPILSISETKTSKTKEGDIELQIKAYHPNHEHLQFQFRESNQNQWQEIPIRQTIRFSDLGDQINGAQFRLTVDGKYYAYSPVFENIKPAPFFWPWWLGFASILIAAIGFYFVLKEKKHAKELKDIKEKYHLREQLEKWRYQARSLQMNPHFLFNSLNSINALISLGENMRARNYLQKFSSLMREVLHFGDIDRIPLYREIEYLKNYLELEKLSRNNHFEYKIIAQADEDIHLPPMLIQPFLENAIIHGIGGIENGKIKLTFQEEQNYLLVEIEDNGIGINSKKKNLTNHHSKALSIVEQRLHSFSKFRKGELQITDKSVYSNNGTGTVVIIKIPI